MSSKSSLSGPLQNMDSEGGVKTQEDSPPVPAEKATKSMHRSVKKMLSALACEVCGDVMVAPSTLPCGERRGVEEWRVENVPFGCV